jgi:hypothetical protein
MPRTSHKSHGMTLIYTLGAILLLSATVALILTYSSSGARSEAGIRTQSNGKDFSELCEEAVINMLISGQPSIDIPARINQLTNSWPSAGAFNKTQVNVSGWLRCSDSNSWSNGSVGRCYECSFEPETTLNGTINRGIQESLTTTYFRVTSIHDTGQGRIHYESIIAIKK